MLLKKGNIERIAKTEQQITQLKNAGFKEISPAAAPTKEKTKQLNEMNVQELRVFAKEKGLQGYSGLSKEELLRALKEVV